MSLDNRIAAYLVTGNPGSGKSQLAIELVRRGLVAIDPDYDPALSYFEDDHGARVLLANGPADPDRQWLESHRWVWNRSRMQERLKVHPGPVFVCGIALNIAGMADVFERLFLLRIDAATQEARLEAHDRANPPGRSEVQRSQIRNGRVVFEGEMLRLGATAINGNVPTAEVADQILAAIEAA